MDSRISAISRRRFWKFCEQLPWVSGGVGELARFNCFPTVAHSIHNSRLTTYFVTLVSIPLIDRERLYALSSNLPILTVLEFMAVFNSLMLACNDSVIRSVFLRSVDTVAYCFSSFQSLASAAFRFFSIMFLITCISSMTVLNPEKAAFSSSLSNNVLIPLFLLKSFTICLFYPCRRI